MRRYSHILCMLCAALVLRGVADASGDDAPADQPPTTNAPAVFTGGVAGVADLADPDHSARYRAAGGGLYLHNNGWQALTDAQRQRVLDIFDDAPIAIELGFNPIAGWPGLYEREYLRYGIEPDLIAANAFDRNNLPTPEQWARYTRGMRAAGVGDDTRILPTFEYANFGENLATLTDNTLSRREDFQQIADAAGGIVLDTPPQFFFEREQAYRDWVLDAIRWCNAQGHHCVVIVSPHHAAERFPEFVDRFVSYLEEHEAEVDAWVSENYHADAPDDYANVVGDEDEPATTLGVGLRLLSRDIEEGSQD
ncbi:hypothetical protein OT109_08830 [Phycisphaeraceae bacterium D3-23]